MMKSLSDEQIEHRMKHHPPVSDEIIDKHAKVRGTIFLRVGETIILSEYTIIRKIRRGRNLDMEIQINIKLVPPLRWKAL